MLSWVFKLEHACSTVHVFKIMQLKLKTFISWIIKCHLMVLWLLKHIERAVQIIVLLDIIAFLFILRITVNTHILLLEVGWWIWWLLPGIITLCSCSDKSGLGACWYLWRWGLVIDVLFCLESWERKLVYGFLLIFVSCHLGCC